MLKKIFSKFKPLRSPVQETQSLPIEPVLTDGWNIPLEASKLLDTPLRQQYLTTIWQNVSMTPDMFSILYRKPIEKFAEMVQLLPASESHHHSHLGGMLDHGLEVMSIATKLRQNYVLPQNAAPEDQAKQRDVWTAIIFYSAMLHDIGKVLVDIDMRLQTEEKWLPVLGKPKMPYRFRYIKERDYNLHPVTGGFIATQLIPPKAFEWIVNFPNAFSQFLYFISGHFDKAGLLSEIIQKADQVSVTMALGGDPKKLSEQPQISFAKQLQIALREVISRYKLNAPQGGGEAWLDDSGLFAMCKTTAEQIRAYLTAKGIYVPKQNTKIFDELQAHNLIETTSTNEAIWKINIESNSGWKSNPTNDKKREFSVLRIPPQIIWDNIDDRPSVFDGKIIITTSESEHNKSSEIETDTITFQSLVSDIELNSIEDKKAKPIEQVIKTDTTNNQEDMVIIAETEQGVSNDMDFVLNLFSPVEEVNQVVDTEQKSEPIQIEKVQKTAPYFEVESQKRSATSTKKTEKIKLNEKKARKIQIGNLKSTASKPIPRQVGADFILGQNFLNWLTINIRTGQLKCNQSTAPLHIVQGHLFVVSPLIFDLYLATAGITDPNIRDQLQLNFQNLKLHIRQPIGENDFQNIWNCTVVSGAKNSQISGYLIAEPQQFFGDKLLFNNQFLTLQGEIQ